MCLTTTPTGWFGQFKNCIIASGDNLPTLQSFHAFCVETIGVIYAETLSSPAIAVENNRFMTSQHNSSFMPIDLVHCPGLHFESDIGSSTTPERFEYRYFCITMKVFRDYICKLDTPQKNSTSV